MTQPADTTDFLAIHTSLRLGGRALAEAAAVLDPSDARRVEALVRYWYGYAGEVLAHHTVEDEIFYPALVERAPDAAEHIARIDAEHHLLDELMAEAEEAMVAMLDGASAAPAAMVLASLDRTMRQHLDFEEADLVPLFVQHFDHAEYEVLTKAAGKSLGVGRQALFTVPFVASWLDDGLRDELFDRVPLAFRVIYRLTRRSHERLAATALGDIRQRVLASEPAPVG